MATKFKACHTSAPKGKRVRVVMRNGDSFIDKFVEKKSSRIIFETRTVNTREMASMTIVR